MPGDSNAQFQVFCGNFMKGLNLAFEDIKFAKEGLTSLLEPSVNDN
jgi:hypothetical protein